MESYLIKGILIGLLFGIPVGAVGAMTVQRTFRYGFKAGLITGLGSSVADCFYACVGAFGLTLLSDFLLKHQTLIHVIGGILVFTMGLRLLISKENNVLSKQITSSLKMFLSSFAVGITNPAAILTFLFAFSYFEITKQAKLFTNIQLIMGVFIGTYLWWGVLSIFIYLIKKKTKNYNFCYMNKLFGVILLLFSTSVFIKTLF